ncbi:MAG: hypothetical protein ACJAUL_000990 [Paraglaciecola sp.]|jgi:hypothetical protein
MGPKLNNKQGDMFWVHTNPKHAAIPVTLEAAALLATTSKILGIDICTIRLILPNLSRHLNQTGKTCRLDCQFVRYIGSRAE